MEAVFHELLAEHNTNLEIGAHTSFDPDSPWDQVWSTATKRVEFWTDQFERPAGRIAPQTRAMSSVLDGDVQIMQQGKGKGAPHAGPHVQQPKKKQQPKTNSKKRQFNRDAPPCVICKSADHAMTQCHLYDPNHNGGPKGKGGKKGKGKGKGKGD